jgi:putative chitinase
MITIEQLVSFFETTKRETLETYVDPLNAAMLQFDINTPERVAMFLAQIGCESGGLVEIVENLNYSAKGLLNTFPTHFTPSEANVYARNPEKIGNRAYANRMKNGNEASGDGYRFRGRGFIQITGRENYTAFAKFVDMDIDSVVDYMETPEGACVSAGWFWQTHNLNTFADAGDCLGATKRINGGTNGLAQREAYYKEALKIFT